MWRSFRRVRFGVRPACKVVARMGATVELLRGATAVAARTEYAVGMMRKRDCGCACIGE